VLTADPTLAASAEASFRRAIEAARKQHAKLPELRATMSLARLLDKQGNQEEARTTLAEIYNWFTEGFDTPDLNDGKQLFAQLAGSPALSFESQFIAHKLLYVRTRSESEQGRAKIESLN